MLVQKDGRHSSVINDEEILSYFKDEINELTRDELEALKEMLQIEDIEEQSRLIQAPEYIREVVSIEQFIEDDYYLGQIGKTLYPQLKKDLISLFSGQYYEAILSGSIGYGKNTFSGIVLCRILYEMSCLRDPQDVYGLEKGSEIALVCLSVTEELAKRAVFGSIKTKILTSKYFRECFPYKQTLTELRFPGNIRIAASSSSMSSALSLNVFGGILDEVNFMPMTPPRVQKIRYGSRTTNQRGSHAETLYHMILRRMKSRYAQGGKLPGILMVVSSKSHTDAFTEKRISAARNDPSIFVLEHSIWDVKGHLYSNQKFDVFVGNERIQSRIIKDEKEKNEVKKLIEFDQDYYDCKVIEVPIDFKRDFETDLETSLQDLAGIATVSISPFIQRRETIFESIDDTREHPMPYVEWDPSHPPRVLWDLVTREWKEKNRYGQETSFIGPLINPRQPRHVHIDTSVNHDATGICIGHIAGTIDVIKRDGEGREYIESAPEIYIDFMLRVVPPSGNDIIMSDIRSLLYSFMDHGFNFGLLTTDQFQSVEMRQYFELQKGVKTELLSVDRTTDPYRELRSALYENRISFYKYDPFIKEMQRVIHDKIKNKIDHLPGESKDCTDAVAAVTYSLTSQPSQMPANVVKGISEIPKDDNDDWLDESKFAKKEEDKPGNESFFIPVMR